jgi:hypothetical protein
MRNGLARQVQLEIDDKISELQLQLSRTSSIVYCRRMRHCHNACLQGNAWGMDHLRHMFRDRILSILQVQIV